MPHHSLSQDCLSFPVIGLVFSVAAGGAASSAHATASPYPFQGATASTDPRQDGHSQKSAVGGGGAGAGGAFAVPAVDVVEPAPVCGDRDGEGNIVSVNGSTTSATIASEFILPR